MRDFFTSSYMLCDSCQYVGRFIKETSINRVKWSRDTVNQWLNHSDYICPKCSSSTTAAKQLDFEEITQTAYNAREGKQNVKAI